MNAHENLGTKCCAPRAYRGNAAPYLRPDHRDAWRTRTVERCVVLDIIEAKNEGRPNAGGEINCFRDSLSDLRIRATRVNSLAHRLLETFQS